MTEHFANQALTTLTAELAEGATTLAVASATRFPTEPNFRILIDSELLMVTAVEGTTFTVERGIEETEDIPHANGSTVTQILTAGALANKADLEEGALLESQIPSSVVLGSQLPAIYASRHGVSAANTGEQNSEALGNAIAEAEEQSIGRILLPGGVIALKSGFLLNKSDDEEGNFQYVIQGEGQGTVLDLDGELDWLFRLNCTESDEPAHEIGNLTGRLQLRDLMVQGVEEGETGLVRTIGASVQMVNVRGLDLNRGVYQISGYCDHHSFENVRWKSDHEKQSWFFETESNGDGHVFLGCSFGAFAKAAKLRTTNGAVIDSCVGGTWQVLASTGVEFREHHVDNALNEEEASVPWLRIEDARVKVTGGYLLVSQTQPLIEVDDPEAANDATQLTIDGAGFGWRVGDPRIDPPRHSHVHIAAASSRARFFFKNPRAFTTRQGTTFFDPIGIVVTSDNEAIQAAIDAGGELLNGDALLISEDTAATWEIRSAPLRKAERFENKPAIPAVSAQTGIGGSVPKKTTRYYQIAVWDGFQWSDASDEKSAETKEDESGFVLAISPRSINSKVRVWWGSESEKPSAYCDIVVPTSSTRLYDTGEYLSGLAWIAEELPTLPTANAQQTLVDLAGSRVLFSDAEEENEEEEMEPVEPAGGEWKQGDICLRTNPEAGGIVGFICVKSSEPEEPAVWKAFGTIAE